MKRLSLTLILILVLAVLGTGLTACDSETLSTATPMTPSSIIGVVRPWTAGTPIADRHVAICRSLGDPRDGLCELLSNTAQTDQQGRFHLSNVPTGVYFMLYDSGLSDFEQAMARWAGETLHFGDQEWLSDFLGVDLSTGKIDYRTPEGITLSPDVNWLSSYCMLTLLVGESPFVIAHDLQSASHDRELHCAIINVLPGQAAKVDMQVLYFGEYPS